MYAAIIAAAAAVIGALIASGQDAAAASERQKIADKYKDLPLPVLDRVVAEKLPPDAAARYTKATQSTQAQSSVLEKFMDSVNNRGETPEDRAAVLRMQQAAGGIASGAMSAVSRQMATRGLSGSGMDFAMKQGGAQAAANRANAMGIEAAAAANTRYMDALRGAGGLSTSMRGQEMDAMRAQDAINMFNARQQSDADTRNAEIPQRNFDNSMTKLAGESNATNQVAAGYERGAQSTRSQAAGVGNAAATASTYESEADRRKRQFEDSSGSDSGR